jgi:putative FmdB family regulatory protein
MPTYEYVCRKCNRRFEAHLTLAEHDKRKAQCPKCRTKDVQQVPEAFYAVTSKKS